MEAVYAAHAEFVSQFTIFSDKITIYRESILEFLENLFGSGKLFDTQGLKV